MRRALSDPPVLEAFALVAEPDNTLRDELVKVLQAAGYGVRECANAPHFRLGLRATATFTSTHLLILVALEMAIDCSKAISQVGRGRSLAGFSRPLVALSSTDPAAHLDAELECCDTAVIPLDSTDADQLERLVARHSLVFPFTRQTGDGN